MVTNQDPQHPALQDRLEFASKEITGPLSEPVNPATLETSAPSDFDITSMVTDSAETTMPVNSEAEHVTLTTTDEVPSSPVELPQQNLAAADLTDVAPVAVPAKPKTRRHRGANPAMDNIWTRHHVLCMMGVVCDVALGGYDAARAASDPLEQGVCRNAVADVLLTVCPWIENPDYLNCHGCSDFEKHGLRRHFKLWVANRVHHFYDKNKPSEHPVRRKKGNIGAVYERFYNAFCGAVSARTVITEERAKEFWQSVSHHVPFRAPASITPNH